jgi:dTDP-4-dehydrorhamnose 3,5-epimerase
MPFAFNSLPIEGLLLITPRAFEDARGFFMETYKHSEFASRGILCTFAQDNHSLSKRGVLRGLHFQKAPFTQAKLVRVISGAVWDVAVDLRPGSPSHGKWHGVELSRQNKCIYYIPEGFAHGFVSLMDDTELVYKCSVEFSAAVDVGVRWDDPDLAIDWPIRNVTVSDKDALLPYLKDLL